MAKRTTEQRIQELQAKQQRELAREQIRAQYDAIEPLLRERNYFQASDAVRRLTILIADAQSMAIKALEAADRTPVIDLHAAIGRPPAKVSA